MDKFQAMQVFVRVVDSNSFSKAAEILEIPRTSVSNIVQNLKSELGVQLMQRTTRKLSLTPEGAEYYERCMRLLADLEDMESSIAFGGKPPRGKLRVDMPPSVAKAIILPALSEFRGRYPDIEITMGATDRTVDLIEDGIDCVIRTGKLEEFNLVTRRVGSFTLATCATPEYLAKYGEPTTLQELERHAAVNYFFSRSGRIRPFVFSAGGAAGRAQVGYRGLHDRRRHSSCLRPAGPGHFSVGELHGCRARAGRAPQGNFDRHARGAGSNLRPLSASGAPIAQGPCVRGLGGRSFGALSVDLRRAARDCRMQPTSSGGCGRFSRLVAFGRKATFRRRERR